MLEEHAKNTHFLVGASVTHPPLGNYKVWGGGSARHPTGTPVALTLTSFFSSCGDGDSWLSGLMFPLPFIDVGSVALPL